MNDFITSWVSIILEGIPFLLMGAFFSGVMHAFQFYRFFRWISFSNKWTGILGGMGAGILLPLCECGSILMVRRMIMQGIPLRVGISYFLSGAILNPITLFTTWVAFQNREPLEMMLYRGIGGVILVATIAGILDRFPTHQLFRAQPKATSVDCEHLGGKWRVVLTTMRSDFLLVLGYYLIGSAFAAWVNTFVSWWKIAPFFEHPVFSPFFSILLAQGMSLCSTIDAFIAASFSQVPRHSIAAFLVAGPLFDLKLMMMYLLLFRTRWVFYLWALITALVWILALVIY